MVLTACTQIRTAGLQQDVEASRGERFMAAVGSRTK
jgi:hypothetical protein